MEIDMLKDAIKQFTAGGFAIIFDSKDREAEADLVIHASFVTPRAISRLRRDAGGLICFATTKAVMQKAKLQYLSDIYLKSNSPTLQKLNIKKTPYGDAPAFSISLNHKKTYTGITDNDRSKTITELAKLIKSNPSNLSHLLVANFYIPGHVPLLFSRNLAERRGHTELAVELCKLSNLPPTAVICEMLGKGSALKLPEVKKYAKRNGIPLIEGREIIEGASGRKK